MALRKILTQEDETLSKPSRVVEKFDRRLAILLGDMADTLHAAGGVGLAAPQVGVLRRVAIVDTGEELLELINPEVIRVEGAQEGSEGCLSFPGLFGMVVRPEKVVIRAQTRKGKTFERTGEGLLARAFCHEIDHLNGELFVRLVSRFIDPEELDEENGAPAP
ncbi:MAG: peptide deformylase [Oscillospiraceae bacterium]|nr:peptide deformylase [Oscillospiraceae bacterium]